MNERTRSEAERVALAQRTQLEALYRNLQTLDRHFADLESASDRQSTELSQLEEQVADLYAQTGLTRPSAEESAAVEIANHLVPSASAATTDQAPDRTGGFVLPEVADNWDTYLRNVERYIAEHPVEPTQDPIAELLPPHRAAEIQRKFEADFGPAAWDRWDYGVVALAVLVGAMLDYLLVATPGGNFKGKEQRGSPLTAWLKDQSKPLAPMSGPDDIQRNAFQRWVAELTTAAEKWAKVPYDVISPKLGLTPNVHRLASLGHDPLLGLVFGLGDIISGTCTFIDKSGKWSVIDHPGHDGDGNVLEAFVKVIVHGFSDVFTAQGLPPPYMAALQLVGANSGMTLRKGGDPVPVRHVVRYMYSNGYDLRHFATTTISPAAAEIVLCSYHGVRAFSNGSEPGMPGIPDRLKQAQMLALTHGLLGSANILKTALHGWNPMAINLAQFQTLAKRMLSLMQLALERDQAVRQRLAAGWEALLDEASLRRQVTGTSCEP